MRCCRDGVCEPVRLQCTVRHGLWSYHLGTSPLQKQLETCTTISRGVRHRTASVKLTSHVSDGLEPCKHPPNGLHISSKRVPEHWDVCVRDSLLRSSG